MEKDLEMSCFNPLAGILLEPLAKQFESLSESQLDELASERHSKKTKDVTNCHKLFWLCYKTSSKRFSVYYLVIVAIGKFVLKEFKSTRLSPHATHEF